MRYKIFAKYGIEAFSTERGGFLGESCEGVSIGEYGCLNLCDYVCDKPEHVETNRELLCRHLGIRKERLVMPRQTHTNNVKVIDSGFWDLSEKDRKEKLMNVDGLVTQEKDICIGINTADCVPIIMYEPEIHVAAAVHAGWRGLVGHIARNAIKTMVEKYGCRKEEIICAVGPHISVESYEVGEELKTKFEEAGFDISDIFEYSTKWEKAHLNLGKAINEELTSCGILRKNIELANTCTFCQSDHYFSARRAGIQSGRVFTGILLR